MMFGCQGPRVEGHPGTVFFRGMRRAAAAFCPNPPARPRSV